MVCQLHSHIQGIKLIRLMSQTVFYELAVLYKVVSAADQQLAIKAVKRQIGDVGGRIVKEDDWGKRSLAYKIKNQTEANYVFYDIELPPQAVKELEASFNIANSILRYQVYRPDLRALQKALDNPMVQQVTESPEAAAETAVQETAKSPADQAETSKAESSDQESSKSLTTKAATEDSASEKEASQPTEPAKTDKPTEEVKDVA